MTHSTLPTEKDKPFLLILADIGDNDFLKFFHGGVMITGDEYSGMTEACLKLNRMRDNSFNIIINCARTTYNEVTYANIFPDSRIWAEVI